MESVPKLPRVAFRLYRGNDLELIIGYLMKTPDGRLWAVSDDGAHREHPTISDSYLLDPSHLALVQRSPDDEPSYLYRVVLNISQSDMRKH